VYNGDRGTWKQFERDVRLWLAEEGQHPKGSLGAKFAKKQQGAAASVLATIEPEHMRGDPAQEEIEEEQDDEGNVIVAYQAPVAAKPWAGVLRMLDKLRVGLEIDTAEVKVNTLEEFHKKFRRRQGEDMLDFVGRWRVMHKKMVDDGIGLAQDDTSLGYFF
jgi:hypothetical protein